MATSTVPRLRPALRRKGPGLQVERELWDAGDRVVVGVDEVGRGAWAGPLTIGAVVVPRDRRVNKIRDSKALTASEREALFGRIAGWCTWSVGHASARECDELGMSAAQRLAARRAIDGLGVVPDRVLVDGSWDFVGGGRTRTIVRGDASCLSIAAASILAKVVRDRLMIEADEHHPAYDFAWNKGYPCPRHRQALRGLGPSALHRRSWSWMDEIPWTGARRYLRPDTQGTLFPTAGPDGADASPVPEPGGPSTGGGSGATMGAMSDPTGPTTPGPQGPTPGTPDAPTPATPDAPTQPQPDSPAPGPTAGGGPSDAGPEDGSYSAEDEPAVRAERDADGRPEVTYQAGGASADAGRSADAPTD